MYAVNEDGIKTYMTKGEIVEKVNKWNPKIVKIIENPDNEQQLRIYVDDFMFINCWQMEEVTNEDKIHIIENVDCENSLYMKDKKWENTLYWATNRFDFGYLTWDIRMDDWWIEEPNKTKEKWTKQHKALLNTKCFLS